jgi:hypothetical protein
MQTNTWPSCTKDQAEIPLRLTPDGRVIDEEPIGWLISPPQAHMICMVFAATSWRKGRPSASAMGRIGTPIIPVEGFTRI